MADDYAPVKNPGTGDGRPGKLNDPETVKAVAECFVNGSTRERWPRSSPSPSRPGHPLAARPTRQAVVHKLIEGPRRPRDEPRRHRDRSASPTRPR